MYWNWLNWCAQLAQWLGKPLPRDSDDFFDFFQTWVDPRPRPILEIIWQSPKKWDSFPELSSSPSSGLGKLITWFKVHHCASHLIVQRLLWLERNIRYGYGPYSAPYKEEYIPHFSKISKMSYSASYKEKYIPYFSKISKMSKIWTQILIFSRISKICT